MRIGFVCLMVVAGALIGSLAGCGGGGAGTNLPDPLVRFVNSSPDSNPEDFFINTDKEAAALAYLSSSADISSKKGDHDISVQDSTNQTVLDDVAFTLAQDKKYLDITIGLENYGTENLKRLQEVVFTYDKSTPNGNQARLFVMHAYNRAVGFETPNIDFQGGQVGSYDPNNPQFSAPNLSYAASSPFTLLVDSGVSLIFQARRAGTENVLASDPGTTFDAGGIYLVLVSGIEGGAGPQAPTVKYIKLN